MIPLHRWSVLASLTAACLASGCIDSGALGGREALGDTITAAVDFEGGTVISGDLPLTTADDVVIEPLEQTVIVAPGTSSILAIDVDNPDEADDPVVATLVQFRGARDHLEVEALRKQPAPAADGAAPEATRSRIENEFSVASNVCDELCDKVHAIELTEVARLRSGAVGRRSTRTAAIDCRQSGSASACEGDGEDDVVLGAVGDPSGNGGNGGGAAPPVDGGSPLSTGGAGSVAPPDDPVAGCGGQCGPQVDGVFAMRSLVDLWWADDVDPAFFDPGRDTITLYFVAEISDACGTPAVTLRACGMDLPVTTSEASCDAVQLQVPIDVWDRPGMPRIDAQLDSAALDPDGLLSLATTAGLWGIELDDPTGAWPTPFEIETLACPGGVGPSCFPDHDGDGSPGLTLSVGRIDEILPGSTCGPGQLPIVFRGMPLDPLSALDDGSVRAVNVSTGLRAQVGPAATIGADCESGVGDSAASSLDLRAVDCVRSDGIPCNAAEAAFVDESVPHYNVLQRGEAPPLVDPRTGLDVVLPMSQGGGPLDQTPSLGPRTAVMRIGDPGVNYDCNAVRNAPFPAL